MNTTELIEDLAKHMELPKALSKEIINFITSRIVKEVSRGRRVKLTGFGIFYRTQRKGRMGRNPQNGAPVAVEPKKVPRFKSGKKFRDQLN